MKKHLIFIFFETPENRRYAYRGLVTGASNGRGGVLIDPNKIFRHITGRDMPAYTMWSLL